MVQRDDGGGGRVGLELRGQPGDVDRAVAAARAAGVAHDEAQRAGGRDVAQRLAVRARQREVLAQQLGLVVVAREDVDGHRQRRHELAHEPELLGRAAVRQVAGEEDRVGPERRDVAHRRGERLRGAVLAHVGVGDLGDQHAGAARTNAAKRRRPSSFQRGRRARRAAWAASTSKPSATASGSLS